MSILRCLGRNRRVLPDAPKFEDARKFKLSTIFRGQSTFQRLLTDVKDFLNRKFDASMLTFPPVDPAPMYVHVMHLAAQLWVCDRMDPQKSVL